MKYTIFFFFSVLFSIQLIAQCEDFNAEIIGHNPVCHDYSDGKIEVIPFGGSEPYEWTIYDEDGVPMIIVDGVENMLLYGWYYITITDSLGCVYLDSIELINPDEVTFEYTLIEPTEPDGCDGFAEVDTVYGYQGDYSNISIIWFPDGPAGIGEWTFEDMCANDYTIYINDDFGCTGVVGFTAGSLSIDTNIKPDDIVIYSSNQGYWINNKSDLYFTFTLVDLTGKIIESNLVSPGITHYTATNLNGVFIYEFLSLTGERITGKLKI